MLLGAGVSFPIEAENAGAGREGPVDQTGERTDACEGAVGRQKPWHHPRGPRISVYGSALLVDENGGSLFRH